MTTHKNFQCEGCLEPFYAPTVLNAENAGQADCPKCGTFCTTWFDDRQSEKRLPRDAYDI